MRNNVRHTAGLKGNALTVSNDSIESAGAQVPSPESVVTSLVGSQVARAVNNSLLGLVGICAAGAFVVFPVEGNPLTLSERLALLFLFLVGLVLLVDAYRNARRARMRPEYGLLAGEIMVRDRKHDWTPFLELKTVEELSLAEAGRYSDNFFVSLRQAQSWTCIGPFERGDRWARVVAERAGEITGSEVPFSD